MIPAFATHHPFLYALVCAVVLCACYWAPIRIGDRNRNATD